MKNCEKRNTSNVFGLDKKEYIFVYGSLLKEFPYVRDIGAAKYLKYIKEAEIYGKIYDLGNYPGLVHSNEGTVVGQVYEIIDSNVIKILDEFEGYDENNINLSEFIRKQVKLKNEDINVWVYYYNMPIYDKRAIESGSWLNYLEKYKSKADKFELNKEFNIIEVNESNGIVLRQIAEKCYPLDVHTHFTYWVMSRYFSKSTFIAKSGEKHAGYIMSIYNEKNFFIWQIGILEEFRGKGLSYMLIDKVVNVALDMGYDTVQVTIADENKASFNTFANYAKYRGYNMMKIDYIEVKDASNPKFLEREGMFELKIKEEYK